jgi:hypothetical protein
MFIIHGYKLEPVRKSIGYTLDGVKKYKRFFLIREKTINSSTLIKKIELNNADENDDITT